MRQGWLTLFLLCGLPAAAAAVQDIDTAPEIFLAEFVTDPASPTFGSPFDLHLTLRVPRALGVTLSDTLLAAEGAEGIGPGRWTETPLPGDSMEIRATFPVVAYYEGVVLLPTLELWVDGAEATVALGGDGSAVERERRTLRPGAVRVAILESETGEGALQPRPPAGVVGGRWSLWSFLAAGAWSVAGVGAIGLAGARWRRSRLEGGRAIGRDGPPAGEALRALDRILRAGAHREGRVDDFYEATTEVARRFASQVDPALGPDLTSGELVEAIEARWGGGMAEGLDAAVDAAESVKFGRDRPQVDRAEGDWARVRDWITTVSEDR